MKFLSGRIRFGLVALLSVGLNLATLIVGTQTAQASRPAKICNVYNIGDEQPGADGIGYYECVCTWLTLVGTNRTRYKCDWAEIAGPSTNANALVYDDGSDNTTVYSLTHAASGGGQYLTSMYAYTGDNYVNRPAGSLAARIQVFKWSGSAWNVCVDSNWFYSGSTTSSFGGWYTYGTQPPCGAGYYGTIGYGYQYNGAWKGGSTWSGYLYLSGSLLAAQGDPGPPPMKAPGAGLRPPRPSPKATSSSPPPGLTVREA